jgi:signal transduction histidine kinase
MMRDVTLQKKLQRDLTAKQNEIQKAYQEMLEQNTALKELDRAKNKFIALTSHELRTPLAAMVATSEVLVLKFYDTDEEREQFIKTIHTEGLHLLEIVNDILDFSKIQAGKMDFFIGFHDLKLVAEKLIENFEHMAAGKEVQLELDVKTDKLKAYVDPLRFRQAFSNVINNAIKFTHPKTKVTIRLESDEKFLTVSVIDQGPGIPQESIVKVFNEFETVGNVNSHHKGTGLGMPITKKIMENMGGAIELSSTVGQGACFALKLPLDKVLAEDLYKDRPTEADDLAA